MGMSPGNELDSGNENSGVEKKMGRRLNLILSETSRAELDSLTKETHRSITDLVRIGLSFVKVLYECQSKKQKIVITTHDDKPLRELYIGKI